jgi:hypothetical protein
MEIREQLQRTLGNAYTFERELGGGGMSQVFVAEETALGRKVVVRSCRPQGHGSIAIGHGGVFKPKCCWQRERP